MGRIGIAALMLALTGCTSEPMTPEQRELAMQYLLAQQARQAPPPQPYYVPPPAPAPVIVQQRPTNCITNQVGNTMYTNCN